MSTAPVLSASALALLLLVGSDDPPTAKVGPVPPALKLDPFYSRHVDAGGIPVVGSAKVSDEALLAARAIVDAMLAQRPDVRAAMVEEHLRVVVMARSESTTDLPEQRDWKKPTRDDPRLTTREREEYDRLIAPLTDREYWDGRARGMGGNPTSGAEENLLGDPGARYDGENILVHEFAHAIMDIGLRRADPELFRAIRAAYRDAMAKGLWRGHYAATTPNEYWAEGTQTWFGTNYAFTADDGRRIATAADLKDYDPTLYDLLARVYGDTHHIPADVQHGKSRDARPRGRRGRGAGGGPDAAPAAASSPTIEPGRVP